MRLRTPRFGIFEAESDPRAGCSVSLLLFLSDYSCLPDAMQADSLVSYVLARYWVRNKPSQVGRCVVPTDEKVGMYIHPYKRT